MARETGKRKGNFRCDIDMSEGELSLSRLFKEIDHLIRQVAKSNKKSSSDISLTGEIKGLASKKDRVLYGFSVKLEKRAKK